MNNKLGQEPAFPFFKENESGYGDTIAVYDLSGAKAFYPFEKGMSKHFYAACAALEGLCADPNIILDEKGLIGTVRLARKCADELLRQENEQQD